MSEETSQKRTHLLKDHGDTLGEYGESHEMKNSATSTNFAHGTGNLSPRNSFIGKEQNIEHFLGTAIVILNLLVLISFFLVAGDKIRSKGSLAYYFSLFFSSVSNIIFLVFQFMSRKDSLVQNVLTSENFHILLFNSVFWLSYPSVFIMLIVPVVYGIFQIISSINPIVKGFHLGIPNEIVNRITLIHDKKGQILSYLAITEPIWLVLLILSVFWNGLMSIPFYYLWLNLRYKYSPYTKFAMNWWNNILDHHVQTISFVNPHYPKFKQFISQADLTKYLP